MKYSIAIRKAAEDDLAHIRHWYDSNRQGLGLEFLAEIDSAIARIAEEPLGYPMMHRDVRRVLVHRFPYKIWFSILASTVVVIAGTHAARGPKFLAARLSESMHMS